MTIWFNNNQNSSIRPKIEEFGIGICHDAAGEDTRAEVNVEFVHVHNPEFGVEHTREYRVLSILSDSNVIWYPYLSPLLTGVALL